MSVTLKDIAEEAGVSPITVSRALRGVGRIGQETRRRIWGTATRLGYQSVDYVIIPPPVKRGKADHSLQLLAPSVGSHIYDVSGSLFLNRLFSGLDQRLRASNGCVLMGHFDTVDDLVRTWKKHGYQGLVLRQPLPRTWIHRLQEIGPVVYAVEFDWQAGVDCVYSNEFRSTADVLREVYEHGHRSIAWLGVLDSYAPHQVVFSSGEELGITDHLANTTSHGARLASWEHLCSFSPPGINSHLIVVERDWRKKDLAQTVAEGIERILKLDPPVTTIVAASDPVAIEVLRQLQRNGIKVPEEMSLVSYGGGEELLKADLPLASVTIPVETIGRVIPELIERRLAFPDAIPVSIQFETVFDPGKTLSVLEGSNLGEVR